MVAIKLLGEQYLFSDFYTTTDAVRAGAQYFAGFNSLQLLTFVTQGKRFQLKNPSLAKQLVKKYSGDKADETID